MEGICGILMHSNLQRFALVEYPAYKKNPVHSSINNIRVDSVDIAKTEFTETPSSCLNIAEFELVHNSNYSG